MTRSLVYENSPGGKLAASIEDILGSSRLLLPFALFLYPPFFHLQPTFDSKSSLFVSSKYTTTDRYQNINRDYNQKIFSTQKKDLTVSFISISRTNTRISSSFDISLKFLFHMNYHVNE